MQRVSSTLVWLVVLVMLVGLAGPALAQEYEIAYHVRIRPDAGIANASIVVKQSTALLQELSADLDAHHWFDFEADGQLEMLESGGFRWQPPATGGRLTYSTQIDRLRDDEEYDSRCMPSWMLTRAEDLFPPMSASFAAGSVARATLEFEVPPRWTVVTPFEAVDNRYRIEQPHRKVDQPKGWLIAGRIDRLSEVVAGTHVSLAAPRKHDARLRDALMMLRLTLPFLAEAAGEMPPRIAIVMADDPMWRGGLAGPDSLYLHADRPFIESDGTSPFLHELLHVVTHARSAPGYDWMVEGLAEFYSLEILRRAGAVSEKTHAESLARLRERGGSVRFFRGESVGDQTARAVVLMDRIDQRIRTQSGGEASLDGVVAALVAERTVLDRETLLALIDRVSGVDAAALVDEVPVRPPEEPR